MERYGEDLRTNSDGQLKENINGVQLLVATFKHMKKPYQLLIVPLTIWSGLEQGFFLSDYTAGYVSCIFGVDRVGWVLITYGVFDAICSVSFGAVIKYTGRIPIYSFGALVNLAVITTLLTWTPDPDKEYILYILSGLWGISDAVWQTQINGK